jgi:hypothetical protein
LRHVLQHAAALWRTSPRLGGCEWRLANELAGAVPKTPRESRRRDRHRDHRGKLGAPLVCPLGRKLRWQRGERGLDARADASLDATPNFI